MTLEKCYLECAEIKLKMTDSNGNFKTLTNTTKGFKVNILRIYPMKKDENEDNYVVGFQLEHNNTKEVKECDLLTLESHYKI